jgi:hypothetical protein
LMSFMAVLAWVHNFHNECRWMLGTFLGLQLH